MAEPKLAAELPGEYDLEVTYLKRVLPLFIVVVVCVGGRRLLLWAFPDHKTTVNVVFGGTLVLLYLASVAFQKWAEWKLRKICEMNGVDVNELNDPDEREQTSGSSPRQMQRQRDETERERDEDQCHEQRREVEGTAEDVGVGIAAVRFVDDDEEQLTQRVEPGGNQQCAEDAQGEGAIGRTLKVHQCQDHRGGHEQADQRREE